MKNEQLLNILIQDKNTEEKQELLRTLQEFYIEVLHNEEYKPQTSLEKQIMANVSNLDDFKMLIDYLHNNITLSIKKDSEIVDKILTNPMFLPMNIGKSINLVELLTKEPGITCDDLDDSQGITCEDLDRVREEYGEGYDDYEEETYGSNIPVINQFRFVD